MAMSLTPSETAPSQDPFFSIVADSFLFSKFNTRKEYKEYLSSLELSDYMGRFCYVAHANHIVVDYSVFNARIKKMDTNVGNMFIGYMIRVFQQVLENYPLMTVHVNLDSFQLLHVDRHYEFFWTMSSTFQSTFPNSKLETCFIYNVPVLFSALLTCLTSFVDKDTKSKLRQVPR